MAADPRDNLAVTETIGSVLWFVMDGFWMLNQAVPARLMVAPTLVVNLLVFRFTKRSFSERCVVAAMNSWLVMNILWMLGDLAGDRRPVAIARVFFALGIVLLALAVARDSARPERLASVFARFRRLRL